MARANEQLTIKEPLDLRFLPDEGLEFNEVLSAEWLKANVFDSPAGAPAPIHTEQDGSAKVEVSPMGPVHTRPPIRVHGALKASVSTTCVRCLEPVKEEIAADLDVTLFAEGTVQKGAKDDDDEEGLTPAEMDEGSYAGNTIDLPAIAREALLLEISMNPVCADETACTARTEAMLAEANRASEGVTSDRWAALRRLRDS